MSNDSPEISIFLKDTGQYIGAIYCECGMSTYFDHSDACHPSNSRASLARTAKKQGAQQTPTRARQNKPFEDPNKEASKTNHAVLLQAGHGACTSRLRGCTLPALLPPEQTEFVRGTKPAPARQSPGNTRCG